MKRFCFTTIMIGIFMMVGANPLVPPSVALSELAFDSNGNWIMEIQCFDGGPYMAIDSIHIESSSGSSMLTRINYTSPYIILVTNDSLNTSLDINPLGDSVLVACYYGYPYHGFTDALVYGNKLTSRIRSPQSGESIAGVPPIYNHINLYSIDNTPTIGVENDTTGMCATLHGSIYDMNNELLNIDNGRFEFWNCVSSFYSKTDGSYTTSVYSFDNQITHLFYYTSLYKGIWVQIDTLNIVGEPDSVITRDIHLLGSLLSDFHEVELGSESIFEIYPNPIKDYSFNYKVSVPVLSSESYIELINLSGQRIAQYSINESSGKIILPSDTPGGTYVVRLFVNRKNYASSKIIVSR